VEIDFAFTRMFILFILWNASEKDAIIKSGKEDWEEEKENNTTS
jgi:hypothetical protein